MAQHALTLTATADHATTDQPLPVRVAVANDAAAPLVDATVELTLEVERGVLMTWELALAEIAAGTCAEHPVLRSEPDYELPLGHTVGDGVFRARLYSAAGAQLAEAELPMPVTSSSSPS